MLIILGTLHRLRSISAQGTKQFLDGIKASISADARETSTSSSKVVESLDVKTTKSILLRRIIEQCASVTLLDNSVEGDLVKVDRVKLELLNEESLRQFLILRRDALKGMRVEGMEVNNLVSSMLQDYAYILKGLVYDESMKEPVSEIIIKIPMEIQSEFENKYNINDLLIGHVSIVGIYKEYRGKKVGYLFQNFELLDNLTGRENILLPTSLHGVSEAESSQRLKQLADYLEITDVLDKFPSKMSGGQRQRVAAARALILHPQMILADEPTGALDSKNARSLMEKLSGLNRDEQATILMVTHDSNAASFCKRILFIQDGVIFHELRRGDESQQEFYGRILKVMAQLGGGSANVF